MSMVSSCAGMDPRGRGGPPMGMAQPGRGGGRGPAATVEGDRWGKRALPPPPPGTGGPAMSNLPALHKTDNKFKVGCAPFSHPSYCASPSGLHCSLCLQCRNRHICKVKTIICFWNVLYTCQGACPNCMWFTPGRRPCSDYTA